MSTLSICIIAQDEAEVIPWTLNCCLHTYSVLGDLLKEVVVVDGGSKDKTVDVVNSYIGRLPLVLLQHPFDSFGKQKNRALEIASVDYIFAPDADMTWTTNFPNVFSSGYYDKASMWDFRMLFTADDAYHFFDWPRGVNMRLWRRGPTFRTEYHEKLEGQTQGLPVCPYVFLFENSIRQSDEALLNRGRRYQKFAKQMEAEGGGPGPENRYVDAKHSPANMKLPIDNELRKLILKED